MSGIEILQSVETNIYAWGWDQIHLASIGLFLGCAISLFMLFKDYCGELVEEVLITFCAISMVVALLSIFPLGVDKGGLAHSYTTYQVLIDEEVNLVEFNEKYEILGVEGKIYTIKERDKD